MHAEHCVEAGGRERELHRVGAHHCDALRAAFGDQLAQHRHREIHAHDVRHERGERQRNAPGADADFEHARSGAEPARLHDQRSGARLHARREAARGVVEVGRAIENDRSLLVAHALLPPRP